MNWFELNAVLPLKDEKQVEALLDEEVKVHKRPTFIVRIHRGGQERDVWVYVMLMDGTVDERIWDALRQKRNVSEAAVEALRG